MVYVTLRVTACSGGAVLAGAGISDGYATAYTNSYGELLVGWNESLYEGYAYHVSKTGYVTRSVPLYNSQNGTTVTTCLDAASSGGGGSGGTSGGISCFIVTAASGSPETEEVEALRRLRDQVAARSKIADSLIAAVYDEYWQFSPAIAEQITGSGDTREMAMLAVVRPLLGWYSLATSLALCDGKADAHRDALVEACPGWVDPGSIAALIDHVRRHRAVPHDAPPFVASIAEHLVKGASLPLVDWAILRPLQTAWELAISGGQADEAIAKWLEDAPIEAASPDRSAGEVAALATLLDFAPISRRNLLSRIDAAVPRPKAVGCTTCGG